MALIAVAATFLAATTLWARSSKTGNHTQSAQVPIVYASRIADGTELQPGTYKVELTPDASSPELMFYQEGKLVAKAPVTLVNEGKKIDQAEIPYNTAADQHVITEIDVHGWRPEMTFPTSKETAMGSQPGQDTNVIRVAWIRCTQIQLKPAAGQGSRGLTAAFTCRCTSSRLRTFFFAVPYATMAPEANLV